VAGSIILQCCITVGMPNYLQSGLLTRVACLIAGWRRHGVSTSECNHVGWAFWWRWGWEGCYKLLYRWFGWQLWVIALFMYWLCFPLIWLCYILVVLVALMASVHIVVLVVHVLAW
jgi:hypothetical protein